MIMWVLWQFNPLASFWHSNTAGIWHDKCLFINYRQLSRDRPLGNTLTVLVYKSLHGLAPPYLSDDCQLVTDVGCRHLRSSDVYTCVVPWTQSQIGDRSFSVAGPRLWSTYRLRSGGEALTLNIIDDYLRRFCSFRLRSIVTFYLSAPDINTLTHTLTSARWQCGITWALDDDDASGDTQSNRWEQ